MPDMIRVSSLWIALAAGLFSSEMYKAGEAVEPTPTNLVSVLRALTSRDPTARHDGVYELLAIGRWNGNAPRGLSRVLRTYRGQADIIKAALINALESQTAYVMDVKRSGRLLSESDSEVWANLVWMVGSLRDPNALNALLGVIETGGMATGGLADLGAVAVDAVLARCHDPSPATRIGAVQVLGGFLTRLSEVRANPEAAARARVAIIGATGDTDPWVRAIATESLLPLRDEPDVRTRLEEIARGDSQSRQSNNGEVRFPVREAAARVLKTSELDLFYVFRTSESGVCRVGRSATAPEGIAFFGPMLTEDAARQVMCTHVDEDGRTPSLCWAVQPGDSCRE